MQAQQVSYHTTPMVHLRRYQSVPACSNTVAATRLRKLGSILSFSRRFELLHFLLQILNSLYQNGYQPGIVQ